MDYNARGDISLRPYLQGHAANVVSKNSISCQDDFETAKVINYQVLFYQRTIRINEIIGTKIEDETLEKTHVCDVEFANEPSTNNYTFTKKCHHEVPFYRPVRCTKVCDTFIERQEKSVYLGATSTNNDESKVCEEFVPIYHNFSDTSPGSLLLLSCKMGIKAEDGIEICSVCGIDHLP